MDGRRIDRVSMTVAPRDREAATMSDWFGVLLTVVLLALNALFVAAEFA